MKKGFTLVEMLVVVTVMGLIMIGITDILLNTFKAKTKTDVNNRLEEGGAQLMSDLRYNVLNASAVGIACPISGAGNSVILTNKFDGNQTTLSCAEGAAISSSSATSTINLTSIDVFATGCANFVTCSTAPDTGIVNAIDFKIGLASTLGGSSFENSSARIFENRVVVRNY